LLKSLIKHSLFAVAPQTATALMSARARAHSQRLVKEWGLYEINQRLIKELGSRVVTGPFRGVQLTPLTWNEHIGPFILGTYEVELYPWWQQVFEQSFDAIIDVGAKFGYYAIGLALRFPRVLTIAFDTDWWARQAIREMAAANHVRNLSVKGYCSPAWLKENLRANTFLVSDCEGYEGDLLCTLEIAAMASATLLVELHENEAPGVTSRIESRFRETHVISRVPARSAPAAPDDLRIASLTQEEIHRASNEIRLPEQEWLFLTPR
jgi:hypothetical protein